jgi:hypothetical protein
VFEMTGRLFSVPSRQAVTVSIAIRDRGPEFGADRFEAVLQDYPLTEKGPSTWAAVNRLVGSHRTLLERRWS